MAVAAVIHYLHVAPLSISLGMVGMWSDRCSRRYGFLHEAHQKSQQGQT